MNVSLIFVRIFFILVSMIFVTVYTTHVFLGPIGLISGPIIGFIFGILLVSLEALFKRFNLRSFNIALLGLFFGYLMGQALVLILDGVLKLIYSHTLHTQLVEMIEIALFLVGIYLGLILTLRASEELYFSIPFVKFSTIKEKKRDILIDKSALSDSRVIDLAMSGLIDFHLVIPRFLIRELYAQIESSDESLKLNAKKALDSLKKLEEHEEVGLRFNDTDFPEVKESSIKLIRLSRLIDANILTADISKIHMSKVEDVRIINLHTLSSAMKPLTESGEVIIIKMQRSGKEPDQGVGYLEDGTMIVVNGGGAFIGREIEANVLSVKHTSSGRMIFCNLSERFKKGSA
ncbi:MAG: hypothetical protein S4CHLAM7_04470 [Chlamydiae bacterium]|nr:hypothetical protein [Chlamydiota bacterium]